MDVDEDVGADNEAELGPSSSIDIDDLLENSRLDDIRTSFQFIHAIKKATLDDPSCNLDKDVIDRLRHPPTTPLSLSEGQRFSLSLFLSMQNAPQEVYTSTRETILHHHPTDELLTLDRVKRLVAEISGVIPIARDMCINSCMAYTGPYLALNQCPVCLEPRYVDKRKPKQTFNTFPLGPQLQALRRDLRTSTGLNYRKELTNTLLHDLRSTHGSVKVMESYEDFFHGEAYLDAVEDGLIKDDDIVIMFSLDGAQLFKNKQSDCWIAIFVVFDRPPDVRYKKGSVLQAFVIPGPNKPKIMESFLFDTFAHVSALQKEGLRMWDASKASIVTSFPFLAMGTADGPGLTYLNGLVGHMGKNGCRLYCGVRGRRKPRDSHYYPALLKPLNYHVSGCDHGDVKYRDVASISPSTKVYEENLTKLVASRTEAEYKANRLATGIVKPSVFLGIDARHRLPIPACFSTDIMHQAAINMPDLLIPLWRGTMDAGPHDRVSAWPWAVLKDDIWVNHGKDVAVATPFLPGSFDRPPRNPALKINSGYKAWEFLLYLYGLGPGVFLNVLPQPYYENFCNLVYGMRIVHQHHITRNQLLEASEHLSRFVMGFEQLYYQRRVDRLHFVRQSIHQVAHICAEIHRVSPPVCASQWTMERTIGNLTQELRQPSNPYANLTQRALLRSQINAVKAVVPELNFQSGQLPHGAILLPGNYGLLRKKDKAQKSLRDCEQEALALYLGVYEPTVSVTRWARLRLPNGQIARSLWGEERRDQLNIRRARNIKVHVVNVFPSHVLNRLLVYHTTCSNTRICTGIFLFPIS